MKRLHGSTKSLSRSCYEKQKSPQQIELLRALTLAFSKNDVLEELEVTKSHTVITTGKIDPCVGRHTVANKTNGAIAQQNLTSTRMVGIEANCRDFRVLASQGILAWNASRNSG